MCSSDLGKFVHDHPGKHLGDFLPATIQGWLDGLRKEDGKPVSGQTRRNFQTVISGFFQHSRKRGLIIDNPCADLERETVKKAGDVEFWTASEAAKLLEAAPAELIPALALSLFAGLRTSEVCRLTWSDISLEAGQITVASKKAKTASRRLVPVSDNLRQWLLPHRKEGSVSVWSQCADNFPKGVSEACERAGVRRVGNGARHSFITARVALTGDVARVSLEAGNSPSTIHQHYRGLCSREDEIGRAHV